MIRARLIAASVALVALAACGQDNLDVESGSVGLRIARSLCPAVGIPAQTGDVTLFDPPSSRAASAIDVVATLTELKPQCSDAGTGAVLDTVATFRVDARRERAQGARDVTLPYFVTVVRAGNHLVSKEVGQITLRFADGQARASATGQARAAVQRAAATLPEDVRLQVTRRRKPEDADASIDPLADPKVRQAVQAASFEMLVGFQLTDAQLQYNVTR